MHRMNGGGRSAVFDAVCNNIVTIFNSNIVTVDNNREWYRVVQSDRKNVRCCLEVNNAGPHAKKVTSDDRPIEKIENERRGWLVVVPRVPVFLRTIPVGA